MLDPWNFREEEAYTKHSPPRPDTTRPVMERDAKEQGKTLEEHCAHLLVHDTPHVQSYEHETNELNALEMKALKDLIAQDGFVSRLKY
jgi:ssRNA-specific RNase YbeY (16S rRNA maturation enzyme)